MNTWRQSKNVLLPLTPQTKYIEYNSSDYNKKKFQIAVDLSTNGCTPQNAEFRMKLAKLLQKELKSNKNRFVVAYNHNDMLRLIENSQLAVVSSCEDTIPHNYFDAINSLTIPIVFSDKMRFLFENELIDYTGFLLHFPEEFPQEILNLVNEIQPSIHKMVLEMNEARKLYIIDNKGGHYIWGLVWSLYMKFLTWLPIRRNKNIEDNFHNHLLYGAM